MLKKEVLIESEVLKGLSEEQIAEIEKLSKNDEQTQIDLNRSEWWSGIDNDIKEVFGLEKSAGVKTYKHLKDVLTDAKEKADKVDSITSELDGYKTKVTTLEEQLKKGGGDEVLKLKIEELEKSNGSLLTEIGSVKDLYKSKNDELENLKKEREGDKLSFQLENRFANLLGGKDIKFLPTIPDAVLKREIEAAKNRVRGKGRIAMDGEKIVFYDENDVLLKNAKKGLDPYTPEDLLLEELIGSGIMDEKRKMKGAGGAGGGKGGGGDYIDLNGAKTQVEAIEIIEKKVLADGTPKTSDKFMKVVRKIAKENSVFELPME